ncbi:hypothetical protein DOY81_005200, partial [Sarcophaga bullata]
ILQFTKRNNKSMQQLNFHLNTIFNFYNSLFKLLHTSIILRRKIFPDGVFGNSLTKYTPPRSCLKCVILSLTCSYTSLPVNELPVSLTIAAAGKKVKTMSGTPKTHPSTTSESSKITASISDGEK